MKKENKISAINKLSTDIAIVGDGAFTLTVTGNDFVPGSVVRLNGRPRPTLFVSGTQLVATIPASDVASAGTAMVDVLPPPTNQLKIAVNKAAQSRDSVLAPKITQLVPSHLPAGSQGFELTVIGDNFVQDSKVFWNRQARPTTFISKTQLQAGISASDIQQAGLKEVGVANPPESVQQTSSQFAATDLEIRSAATRQPGPVANESIALAIGPDLAFVPATAPTGQTAPELEGTKVSMLNPPPVPEGFKEKSPLFSVDFTEVKLQIPLESEIGTGETWVADTSVRSFPPGFKSSLGVADIVKVAPGLFFLVDGAGNKLGDGEAVRSVGGVPQPAIKTAQCSAVSCTANPIALAGTDKVTLTLFGTGFRHFSALANVSAKIGNVAAKVTAAGAHASSIGLDFVVIEIPLSLGAGFADVELTVDSSRANVVKILIG